MVRREFRTLKTRTINDTPRPGNGRGLFHVSIERCGFPASSASMSSAAMDTGDFTGVTAFVSEALQGGRRIPGVIELGYEYSNSSTPPNALNCIIYRKLGQVRVLTFRDKCIQATLCIRLPHRRVPLPSELNLIACPSP